MYFSYPYYSWRQSVLKCYTNQRNVFHSRYCKLVWSLYSIPSFDNQIHNRNRQATGWQWWLHTLFHLWVSFIDEKIQLRYQISQRQVIELDFTMRYKDIMRMKTKTSRAMALLPKLAFMALHKRCSVEKKNQEKGKKNDLA